MLFPGNSRWNPYLSSGDKSSSEMTVRRNRFASSVPPGYFSSTKGHSALRKWSYAPTSRASLYTDDVYYPDVYVRPRAYDTTREENDIRREVNSELIYTSNLLDDTYDVAARSRNRDQSLLRDATRALPSSDQPEAKKTGASLTPARRFQSRSTTVPPSLFTKGPTTYPRLAPPLYRGTTNVQPLGILTNIDWASSPLTKFAPPGRIYELNDDDTSEVSASESARSSPERERGRLPKRLKGKLGPGRKVSNYYNRLVQRRAIKPSSNAKYYPYMDVESIASDDADVVSNGEYYNNDYQTDMSDAGSGEYYVVERERSPSPIEYIPFGPRRKIDFSSGEYDCQVPSLSDLSMSPYAPQSDIDTSPERAKVSNDQIFHDIVARTASKARDALQNVNLDEYNDAALVISVEGEYKDPVKGENMGFHYIARPLTLKGPMLATGPAMYASTASDSAFTRYMDDMASFRAQVRNRLETGYKTLSEVSSKYPSHSYPIVASSHRRYCRTLSPPRSSSPLPNRSSTYVRRFSPERNYSSQLSPMSNLRKRLEEIEDKYRRSEYGKRLEEDIMADRLVVYPISEKAHVTAITAPETLPGHTQTVDLYQASAKGTELSTLEKINIKVDTETYTSPRSSVTSRRIRATTVAPRATSVAPRAVSCPPTSFQRRNQAALVGNRVEVNLPHRKKPKSSYAANKMRELKREEREYEVEAVPLQVTTGLKASSVTPNYIDGGKSFRDEEGKFTAPKNLMSWKYRIESRVPPDDYLFPIKTIGHVRDRLLHVKEQMDRHKQLMDRYLPDEENEGTDVKTKIMNMYVDMEHHNPYLFRGIAGLLTPQSSENSSTGSNRAPTPRRAVPNPFSTSADYKPMSDVRRRVRRVICKNRGNPRYFKED